MTDDWKKKLAEFFDEYRIILASQKDTLEDFDQFCEFIVEPAFESLQEELREYGIRSKIIRIKGKLISLVLFYGKSRIDRFQYTLELPRKSVEMRLRLRIRGRNSKKAAPEESTGAFLPDITPQQVMKLDKDILIIDVIDHYRDFIFSSEAAVNE